MEIIHTKNSKELAESIAQELSVAVFAANVRRFSCGEISVSVPKSFSDVVVVAALTSNEDWIELFFLLDALRDARNIILCAPYLGYSRQDKQNQNESFGARLISRLLETAHISRCIILDNHSEPLLRIPYVHLSASRIFEADIMDKYDSSQIAIVSPDIGGAYQAGAISKALRCDLVICNKTRDVFGELKKVEVIGNVADKICILVDDIADTCATLCCASETLLKAGGRKIVAYSTHGILSSGSVNRLEKSDISELVLTDSIPGKDGLSPKIRKLSVASLIAEAIRYIL